MSDFEIVSKDAKVDTCYGLETFHIAKEEIDALLSGKKLYSTVNCGEYAIAIVMAESEDEDSPEEEEAHWIETEVRGTPALICSSCGKDTGTIFEYDICPNCGKKMNMAATWRLKGGTDI